jgi:hypothetical protein
VERRGGDTLLRKESCMIGIIGVALLAALVAVRVVTGHRAFVAR